MRNVLLGLALFGLVASGANAALLELRAADGSGQLELAPGETGNMSIVLTIRDIDTLGFAFTYVFLDDDDNWEDGEVNVITVTEELVGTYDDSAFTLPADISHDVNNEYSLIFGNQEGSFGPGTYILTTLTLRHDGMSKSGEVPVAFEKGFRAPGIFTEDFVPYIWDIGFDNIVPHFSDPGVGGYKDPFLVNFVPEPASLALVAFGGLALLRRRSGMQRGGFRAERAESRR